MKNNILKLNDYYYRIEKSASYCSKNFSLYIFPTKGDHGEDLEPIENETFCWSEIEYLPNDCAQSVNEYFGTDFKGDDKCFEHS